MSAWPAANPEASWSPSSVSSAAGRSLKTGTQYSSNAVITSLTTAQGYVDAGNPVKIVGDPVFYEPLSVGFDKSADPSSESLYEAVDQIVGEMHDDGTLTAMSQEWYDGTDLTKQQ